jgi:hypothetical protein
MFRTGFTSAEFFCAYNNLVSTYNIYTYGLGIKHIQIKVLIVKIYYCISHCITII